MANDEIDSCESCGKKDVLTLFKWINNPPSHVGTAGTYLCNECIDLADKLDRK